MPCTCCGNPQFNVRTCGDSSRGHYCATCNASTLPSDPAAFFLLSQLLGGGLFPPPGSQGAQGGPNPYPPAPSSPTSTSTTPGDLPCQLCKKTGHLVADCPNKPQTNGMAGNNNNNQQDDPESDPANPCANCQRVGHRQKHCPFPRSCNGNDIKTSPDFCSACGKEGHWRDQCGKVGKATGNVTDVKSPQTAKGDRLCLTCGTRGHTRHGCRRGGV
jgi:hypothetical protein